MQMDSPTQGLNAPENIDNTIAIQTIANTITSAPVGAIGLSYVHLATSSDSPGKDVEHAFVDWAVASENKDNTSQHNLDPNPNIDRGVAGDNQPLLNSLKPWDDSEPDDVQENNADEENYEDHKAEYLLNNQDEYLFNGDMITAQPDGVTEKGIPSNASMTIHEHKHDVHSNSFTDKLRFFSRTSDAKPDGELLRAAKLAWHTFQHDEPTSSQAASSSSSQVQSLPVPSLSGEQLEPKPLCKSDERASSVGPSFKTARSRTNRTARTRTPSPTPALEGWEHQPGVPKTGYFLKLLERVRQPDAQTPQREKQAFQTFLDLSAKTEANRAP
jgi:hypothetical protein